MSMVTCPSCRSTVLTGVFCGDCGRPLPQAVPVQAAVQQPVPAAATTGYPTGGWPQQMTQPTFQQPAFQQTYQQPTFQQTYQQQPFQQPVFGPPTMQLPPSGPMPPAAYVHTPAPLSLGRPRRFPGIVVAILVLALVGAGYVAVGKSEHHAITGQLSLYDTDFYGTTSGASCAGSGGYSDIESGTQVVVTDESGATVATDELGYGTYDGTACVFQFTVRDVPKAKFYRVRAGNSLRSGPQYSYDDLRHQHWSVQLSLGT